MAGSKYGWNKDEAVAVGNLDCEGKLGDEHAGDFNMEEMIEDLRTIPIQQKIRFVRVKKKG